MSDGRLTAQDAEERAGMSGLTGRGWKGAGGMHDDGCPRGPRKRNGDVPRILVTAAVIRRGDLVLLARRRPTGERAGLWEFPGGKVEPGETPEEGLRRELVEELAVEVEVGPLLLSTAHDYPDKSIRLLAYQCALRRGEPQAVECAEVRWMTPDELSACALSPADEPIAACVAPVEGGA